MHKAIRLPGPLGRLQHTREYAIAKDAIKRLAPYRSTGPSPVDDTGRSALLRLPPRRLDWPEGVPKPSVGLVQDRDDPPYWTKYRRYLEVNHIPYRLYDIHRSDWRRGAADLDVVLWRPMSVPSELEECRRKVGLLENVLGVTCYPSLTEALVYEDKLLQYELLDELGFPVVPTFVSYSQSEALAFARSCTYPAVWKIACGASSLGVELVRDRRAAERRIRRAFSLAGRRTIWPYEAQKDYVYLQRFQPNAGYDLRVIVIGDTTLGYHRAVPPGDFRASGMGTTYHRAIPQGAMLLARRVRDALGVTALGWTCLPTRRRGASPSSRSLSSPRSRTPSSSRSMASPAATGTRTAPTASCPNRSSRTTWSWRNS